MHATGPRPEQTFSGANQRRYQVGSSLFICVIGVMVVVVVVVAVVIIDGDMVLVLLMLILVFIEW